MTSRERVSAVLGGRIPDRVPLALPFTYYGAREARVSTRDYYSTPRLMAASIAALQHKYPADIVYAPCYAAIQLQPWGGEVSFPDEGAPTPGATPVILRPEDVNNMEQPRIHNCEPMQRCLAATRELRKHLSDEVPIAAAVISPFALPQLQMGRTGLLQLLSDQPRLFEKLLAINEELCVEWTNALVGAGVSLIMCIDCLENYKSASASMHREMGYPALCSYVGRTPAQVILKTCHSLLTADEVIASGAVAIMVEQGEDLATCIGEFGDRLAVFGGLDVNRMQQWSSEQVFDEVTSIIEQHGKMGGFFLSDNSDGISKSVPSEILAAVSRAAHSANT